MDTGAIIRITVFYLSAIASLVVGGFVFQWGTQLWGTGGELFGGLFAIVSIFVRFWGILFVIPAAAGLAAGTCELVTVLKRR
ncbi:MAG: hypothetical protein IPM54_26135 [Polyangiaceae bacterium]|nr:hypothetical protein [Polyangiaceae bacterium]